MTKTTFFALSNPGMEDFLFQEAQKHQLEQIIKLETAITFKATISQAINFLKKTQLARSFHLLLDQKPSLEALNPEAIHKLDTLIQTNKTKDPTTLSVRVKCVSGNETRIEMGGKISQKIRDKIKTTLKQESKVNYKTPDYRFIVSRNNKKYILGLRLHTEDLDKREYRVFHHKAGYKGDFAAAFLYLLDLQKQENNTKHLITCLGREGMFAIEAAKLRSKQDLRQLETDLINKIPILKNQVDKEDSSNPVPHEINKQNISPESKNILFVSAANPNIRAAKNNAKLAKVNNHINFKKAPLDEYAFSLHSNIADLAIAKITKKDERDLNELYYQLSELLNQGGKALIIYRPNLDLSVSERFKILKQGSLERGDGEHSYLIIELL